MCSLERATDRTVLPAEEDEPGALNPGKALKAYLKGARTPRLRGYLGGTRLQVHHRALRVLSRVERNG
jgi:hypothetical protein